MITMENGLKLFQKKVSMMSPESAEQTCLQATPNVGSQPFLPTAVLNVGSAYYRGSQPFSNY